jgi:tripartite-type tricarboxylate transporter receptor subunit TctC
MVVKGYLAANDIDKKKMKLCAAACERRLLELPDVPTGKEAGIVHFEMSTWFGLPATGETPREIVKRWNAEWLKTVAMPDTRDRMRKDRHPSQRVSILD